jgi:hypothetical protein
VHGEIDGKCGKGGETAQKPRRDEGAMAGAREYIVPRRRVQQRI